MTHEELLNKAMEALRKLEPQMQRHERIRGVTVDRLPKRRVRDAVVINFKSDEDVGSIEVTMERDTGKMIGAKHAPPKKKSDDKAA